MVTRVRLGATELDARWDSLTDELRRLKRESKKLTQGFRNEEILSMESGEPREGADADEEQARKNFQRIREIEGLLYTNSSGA